MQIPTYPGDFNSVITIHSGSNINYYGEPK